MKVLFYLRADHEERPGGDLIQMRETAAALEKQGVSVDWSSDAAADVTTYDVVHIFNSPRFDETLAFMKNAKKQGVPVAFSTIYWPKHHLSVGTATSGLGKLFRTLLGAKIGVALWAALKTLVSLKPGSKENIERQLFMLADVLLPNSDGEMQQIRKYFSLGDLPYISVRNAVDTSKFQGLTLPDWKDREDCIVSVGRIEPRKNTLALLQACVEAGVKVRLIGALGDDATYTEACMKIVEENKFEYIPHLEHKKILGELGRCKVYAQVSWYETPGLASLEALAVGCQLVSTELGSTVEYFDKHAIYCDPYSVTGIAKAVTEALHTPPRPTTARMVLDNYNWDLAAKDTLEGYSKAGVRNG